jgi:hypothetical protein
LELTLPASGGGSVGNVRLQTKSDGVCLLLVDQKNFSGLDLIASFFIEGIDS